MKTCKSMCRYMMILCFVCISCTKKSSKLEDALKAGGNNRSELEEVLRHYSKDDKDSLKLKAAIFLIENMPGHYTLRGDKIDSCRNAMDRDTTIPYYLKKLADIMPGHFEDTNVRKEEDVQHIKAAYLVRHIDATFELFERYGLNDIIPFEVFLEYILPYRFASERPDLWRDSVEVLSTCERLYAMPNDFNKLRANFYLKQDNKTRQKIIKAPLIHDIRENCKKSAFRTLFDFRLLGIPATIDFVPFFSNRNGYHYWCSDPPFLYKESGIQIASGFDRKTARVFRRTFSRNPLPVPHKGEYIPEFFLDPFVRDVTDSYYYTKDVKIETDTPIPTCYAYLCVFNDLEWKPVIIGKTRDKTAVFENVVKNTVYLPIYYREGKMTALHLPFILNTKGELQYLSPDSDTPATMRLERKNPDLLGMLAVYHRMLKGLVVEASEREDFLYADTVFVLDESKSPYYEASNLYPSKTYKWYRMGGNKRLDIAELYFTDDKGNFIKGETNSAGGKATDGNPLTYVSLFTNPLVIRFDEPVCINKFICLPRNDGNGIYPGNTYELFYFDVEEGWTSAGIRDSGYFNLVYERIPSGALYWLRNLSEGVEERIFTYKDGTVTFW